MFVLFAQRLKLFSAADKELREELDILQPECMMVSPGDLRSIVPTGDIIVLPPEPELAEW